MKIQSIPIGEAKVIIIKLQGGLGNQMFQYAFFEALKQQGYDVFLDTSYYTKYKSHNGYELEKVFSIKTRQIPVKIKSIANIDRNLYNRLQRRFFPKNSHYIERIYNYDFNIEKIYHRMKKGNLYLDGYWDNEMYFKNIENKIKAIYKFKKPLDKRNQKIIDLIKKTESVSLHIRRGDKVNHYLHINLSINYYIKGIDFIINNIKNPVFFIFSDDIDWVKVQFNTLNHNFIYVDWNKNTFSYIDMYLMSNCKHNIVAASSFSWWSAYLNSNRKKIVLAPLHVFKKGKQHLENKNFYPESWIKI